MGNTLEGAMALNKAKNFASEAGLAIPSDSSGGDKKQDAKIAAKMEKQKSKADERKALNATKNAEMDQRRKDREARKAELEKARGFR